MYWGYNIYLQIMKAIIFDIDDVVVKSMDNKNKILKEVFEEYNLYKIPWIPALIHLWVNRKILIKKISELTTFNQETVLDEINKRFSQLENNPESNSKVVKFIKNNSEKYLFFTNTAMSFAWLERVINALWLNNQFQELLAFDQGNKVENTNYVMKKYNINPKDILFIDDNINHINNVKKSWVFTLHFTDFDINIEEYIKNINNKKNED